MDNFSFKFFKKFSHTAEGVGCVFFSSFSSLVLSRPFAPITAQVSEGKMGKLAMLFGKAGYAFWESWLCFLGKLAMLFGKAGYAFWESWLCFLGKLAMLFGKAGYAFWD